ncbi:MAG: cation transporter [Cyclobacteriaceae bacterium]|nr:cation transporter [Cyclobacteriaceae bacterium]
MKQSSGNKSIYAALFANLLIAITKFIAGGFTNSSSMISEGIHSVVDTTNQVLLLYGLKRSKRPADKHRPFGYGKELYFWAFIVSILIFGLGGGLSIYQGINHIVTPEELTDPFWNYVVLVLSLLFEGISFAVAFKEFNKVRGELSIWNTVITSKDPAIFLVLFEDAAAVAGLLIVLVFMLIAHTLHLPYLDGVASVCVGLLLVFVSFILARESRSLLMGEGIAPETQKLIKILVEKDATIVRVKSMLSSYQSPEAVVLMLIVEFKPDLDTEDITNAIERIRVNVKLDFPLVQFVIVQPEA